MSFLYDIGVRYHAEAGRRRQPTRTTPWLGLVVGTNEGGVKMEKKVGFERGGPAPRRVRAPTVFRDVGTSVPIFLVLPELPAAGDSGRSPP